MKFLIDQDVYVATSKFFREHGHDVVTAAEMQMHQATDVTLLQLAHAQGRILVTRDRDYGVLVFVSDEPTGVLYLRIDPATVHAVHLELERVLSMYTQEQLLQLFCVVEPGRHRTRRT